MKKLFSFLCCAAITCNTFSQAYFMKSYGTPKDDIAIKLVKASDSTFLLWGWVSGGGGLLIKTNTAGEQIYLKHIPQIVRASDILKLSDDNYVLIGSNNELVKVNSDGIIQWHNLPLNYNYRINTKNGYRLDDSHFIVVGDVQVFSHMSEVPDLGSDSFFVKDILVEKYHNTGLLIKRDTIDLKGEIETSNQVLVVNNQIHILCNSDKYGNASLGIIRLDSNLNKLFDTVYQNSGLISSSSFAIDETGNYLVTGSKRSGQMSVMFVEKFNANGEKIWGNIYQNPINDSLDGNGAAIVNASNGTISIIGGMNTAPQQYDLLYLNLDSSGNTIFYKTYDIPGVQGGRSLIELENNNLAIFGTTDYNSIGGTDYFLIVCDSLGVFHLNTRTLPFEKRLTIYPNPAKSTINVMLPEEKMIKSLSIYDNLGKSLLCQSFDNLNEVSIDTQLIPGVYIILVEDFKGDIFSDKLIIE